MDSGLPDTRAGHHRAQRVLLKVRGRYLVSLPDDCWAGGDKWWADGPTSSPGACLQGPIEFWWTPISPAAGSGAQHGRWGSHNLPDLATNLACNCGSAVNTRGGWLVPCRASPNITRPLLIPARRTTPPGATPKLRSFGDNLLLEFVERRQPLACFFVAVSSMSARPAALSTSSPCLHTLGRPQQSPRHRRLMRPSPPHNVPP